MLVPTLLTATTASATRQNVLNVWTGVAPGSENWMQKEETTALPQIAGGTPLIRNVTQPTLTAFIPEPAVATGTAIVVCPGGGFQFIPWEHEGTEIAKWLSSRGIAAVVLKYRLLDTGPTAEDFRAAVLEFLASIEKLRTAPAGIRGGLPDTLQKVAALAIADGVQAMSVVRQHALEWNIAPDRVGMMGFSAGAIVTMGVLMHNDIRTHPNFAATIYGAGMERFVPPADAVPLFILSADNDPIAAHGSAAVYSKWKAAAYPVELHIYAKGGHGFGLNKQNLAIDRWTARFEDWLEEQGLPRMKR